MENTNPNDTQNTDIVQNPEQFPFNTPHNPFGTSIEDLPEPEMVNKIEPFQMISTDEEVNTEPKNSTSTIESSTTEVQILTPINDILTPNAESLTPINDSLTSNAESLTPINDSLTPNAESLTPINDSLTPNVNSLTQEVQSSILEEKPIAKPDEKVISKKAYKSIAIYPEVYDDVMIAVSEQSIGISVYCSNILSKHREILHFEDIKLELSREIVNTIKLAKTIEERDAEISNLKAHIEDLNTDISKKEEFLKLSGIENAKSDTDELSELKAHLLKAHATQIKHFEVISEENDEILGYAMTNAIQDVYREVKEMSSGIVPKIPASEEVFIKFFGDSFSKHGDVIKKEIEIRKQAKKI